MNDLTTSEGVFTYLSGTRFAATEVYNIGGGFSAFTYRVILSRPLSGGRTTIVLKHYEGYAAATPALKIDSTRSEFEYNALVALWDSGLVDFNTVVQVPRPIHYDRKTDTIFLSDLGSNIVKLGDMFGDCFQRAYDDTDRARTQAMALNIGSALGDFLGRLHRWSTSPEHRQLFLHPHRRGSLFGTFCNLAARSAIKFDIKEEWLTNMLAEELRKSSIDDKVLAMGDCSLNNILVHQVPDVGNLRLYVVDWELCRPACPESDLGELTGTWLSLAHCHHIGNDFPFLPSLYKAYYKHCVVDPTRIVIIAGLHTMGLGTTASWVTARGDEMHKQITLLGYELMNLARGGEDCVTSEKSPLNFLFN
ncbi:hypothetical protein OPQ81_008777 [Rhizoctonia solani]|nr:hypothetical protein OPQ81_008777 [Rhizoctonia solani]